METAHHHCSWARPPSDTGFSPGGPQQASPLSSAEADTILWLSFFSYLAQDLDARSGACGLNTQAAQYLVVMMNVVRLAGIERGGQLFEINHIRYLSFRKAQDGDGPASRRVAACAEGHHLDRDSGLL